MSEENKALVRRFFEEFITKGDLSLTDELIAENYVDHNPPGPNIAPGPEGVKQLFAGRRSAFPDLTVTVDDQVAEGDKVVSRGTITGTHKGEFMGIPATGKSISMGAVSIFRIEDGKIAERWGEVDTLGMMQQLGVVPPPPGESRD
jgi:steroid delta-isomerase-like uncharacterized protein